MQGAALAAKRKHESEIALAWHIAAFSGAASVGKLKKLDHYLPKKPGRQQSPDEMLEMFRGFQARGAAMAIERMN